MNRYTNIFELTKATDEEIDEFFKEAVFMGIFDTNIPDKYKGKFCGEFTDISINGEINGLCPKSLFVPQKYKAYVKAKICQFYCVLNKEAFRNKNQYRLLVLKVVALRQKEVNSFDTKEEAIFKHNLKLQDNRFVGQFTRNSDGSFAIRDIRRSDFSKLILQNGKEQNPIVYHPKTHKPTDGKYYEFTWVLNGVRENYEYLFKVDELKPFIEITPHELVNRLYKDIMSYPSGASQKIVKMLDTLKNQLTASGKEIFIYELLQNANDYPFKVNGVKEKVDVEFHITGDSLLFMHSGAEFKERNIAAICSINDKEKTDNKETIGYKGIGFKTVFLDNNYVYLQTGQYSFRFDKEATRDIVDTPWQILPIWTKFSDLTSSERYVFTTADPKFRVKFSLRPTNHATLRESSQNYVKMFKEVFASERVILFIPNLRSVKVFLSASDVPDINCHVENSNWEVDDFDEKVPLEITESINSDIDKQENNGSLKIPTKYYNFTQTRVSFACQKEGAVLCEVPDSQLYCYLPTKASWGFKFLLNTDMIPTGPRDDVEIEFTDTINVNEEISEIAGKKFFDWIKKLCDSKSYKLTSVFSLIPVFETCIREHKKYKSLIERFENGFEHRLESESFIPTETGEYALLGDTILDETGLMSAGFLSDENFMSFNGLEGYLPKKILRSNRDFKDFQRRYLRQFDKEDNIWSTEDLKNLCSVEDFKSWLKVQDNNDKFLAFLLQKDLLDEIAEEEIFIDEVSGELYSAGSLYYNIDYELENLQAFEEYLPHLSFKTRSFFTENKAWDKFAKTSFADFDASDFISQILGEEVSFNDAVDKLQDKDVSILFYHFLAEYEVDNGKVKDLPVISDADEVISNFNFRFIFFSSEYGHQVANYRWLQGIDMYFVSAGYDDLTLEYFKDKLAVVDFDDSVIANDIILSEDYQKSIAKIESESLDTSIAFFEYCLEHKKLFKEEVLGNIYPIHVFEIDGSEEWATCDNYIFFPSSEYDFYSQKEWIDSDWMYVLDKKYLSEDSSELREFLSKAFDIRELNDKEFYEDVVQSKLSDIFSNISGSNDSDGHKNVDFVKYLDDNYHIIFEEEKDEDKFNSLIVVSNDTYDIKISDGDLYLYDNTLLEIINASWFPKGVVNVCFKEYGDSKSLLKLGVQRYSFQTLYTNVIVPYLDNINEQIDGKEGSVAFHNFIIEHLDELTPDQQKEMANAKVYLLGEDEPSSTAAGHKILSNKAKELFNLGIVKFSDLDIIDPIYNTEKCTEYWETRLGNTKYTVSHFLSWLKNNTENFYKTLEDETLNIRFWQWVKNNNFTDKQLQEFPKLPILLKDNTFSSSDSTIYFSDEYLEEGSGIEQIVKEYDETANFLSAKYIQVGESIDSWEQFWEKIGVKYEIVDILYNTVIPDLSNIEDSNLPKLIADNRQSLDEKFEDDLVKHLTALKVKAQDGNYYDLSDTIYIDCEKEEPFSYILLPNQISFKTSEERNLIRDILDEIDGDYVETLSDWQQRKVDYYLEMQDKDTDRIRDFHFQFINELSVIREKGFENLKEIEHTDKILLLDKDGVFCSPSVLTMGSIYKPFFDFELAGVKSLDYVSDLYDSKCDKYPGKLFRSLKIHCDFQREDVKFLEERKCAVYFWETYLKKKDAKIDLFNALVKEKAFDNLKCIPTRDYMKTPSGVYYGQDVYKYIKFVEDAENKVPLVKPIKLTDDVTTYSHLPFRKSLTFLDALYVLVNVKGAERRKQLLSWMIEQYDESYDSKVLDYRADDNAKWFNTKNDYVQIQNLYALDNTDKSLEQYFGNNPNIINKDYLPDSDDFKKACDILQIKTISSQDLDVKPQEDEVYVERNNDLRLFSLVIAGFIDSRDWKSLYDDYSKKLSVLTLHKCESIMIVYSEDENIRQSLRKFYHEKGTDDFYFVKSLDNKRVFGLFVKEFMSYLNIDESDISEEFVEDVMDNCNNAIELVKEQNELMIDEAFKAELDNIIPGVGKQLIGNAASDTDDNDGSYYPGFTTREPEPTVGDITTNARNANAEENGESIDDDIDDSDGPEENTEIYEPSDDTTHGPTVGDPNSEINGQRPSHTPKYPTSRENSTVRQPSHKNKPRSHRPYGSYYNIGKPRNYTQEEIDRLRSQGIMHVLKTLPPTQVEVDALNNILGENMTPEAIADSNYLAQLRLYDNLINHNLKPIESRDDFIRSADKREHSLAGGKYIHKCSAYRGIMYISPSIWRKVSDDECVIVVYYGPQAYEYKYFNTKEELLDWIGEDDLVIKLTGSDKVNVIDELYSGILKDAKGTAYTLVRIASDERYNSVFAKLDKDILEDVDEDENDYE